MPNYFVIPRKIRKRLRNRIPEPKAGPAVQPSVASENNDQSVLEPQREGVVRISCSLESGDADLLKGMRSQVLRATGNPCTASAIVRTALIALSQRPINEVIMSLESLATIKPGPRSKDT